MMPREKSSLVLRVNQEFIKRYFYKTEHFRCQGQKYQKGVEHVLTRLPGENSLERSFGRKMRYNYLIFTLKAYPISDQINTFSLPLISQS